MTGKQNRQGAKNSQPLADLTLLCQWGLLLVRKSLNSKHAIEKTSVVIFNSICRGPVCKKGIMSLMQMAKISAAVKQYLNAGLLYLTVLTDPNQPSGYSKFRQEGDII